MLIFVLPLTNTHSHSVACRIPPLDIHSRSEPHYHSLLTNLIVNPSVSTFPILGRSYGFAGQSPLGIARSDSDEMALVLID